MPQMPISEYVFCDSSCYSNQTFSTKDHGVTADSKILNVTCPLRTVSLERTPNGNVMFLDETCPDLTPKATGTPRSPTILVITSGSV